MRCPLGMYDSHGGNWHPINYVSNAFALFEQQRSKSAQPIEFKCAEEKSPFHYKCIHNDPAV